MIIQIGLVSGRKIFLENKECKTIEEWIKQQFKSYAFWYQPDSKEEIAININNIESVEEFLEEGEEKDGK